MAGHHYEMALDPAIVKQNEMMKNRYKYFRWTGRTAWITVAYAIVVPSIVGYLAFKTDGKYEFRGKKRGDTIAEF